jgi:hypothetical protein
VRAEFAAADRVFTRHQGVLTDKVLDPIKNAVILDAIARGEIPPPPLQAGETMVAALRRATAGEWRFPAKLSIDVGRESAANLNENRQGAKSLQEIAGEEGTDAFARLEQIAIEASYVKELSTKYGVPETAIRMVTQQLPANAAMASALGVNVTQDAIDASVAAAAKPDAQKAAAPQTPPAPPTTDAATSSDAPAPELESARDRIALALKGPTARKLARNEVIVRKQVRIAAMRKRLGNSNASLEMTRHTFERLGGVKLAMTETEQ